MKHFNRLFTPAALAWIFPLLLIIPNIVLAFTERDPLLSKVTDVILPLGVYYILMSITVVVGRAVLFCLPFMVLACFQIVLLYLYGESIIAIDMFLNIATTNTKEVSELLSNLIIAIITVLIIYLPPIIWAIMTLFRHSRCSNHDLRRLRLTGISLSSVGLILLLSCYIAIPSFSICRAIFPVNVISNMVEAVNRTIRTADYHYTSSSYTFSPRLTHHRDMPELYVLVVGETSRADNWQLYGYDRPTNPRLSMREGLKVFKKTLSESNTTHKSVPMMLSPLTSVNFGDSIYFTKGICDAFNEAGFNTAFFSNQQRNHSFIDFFAYQAQTTEFIRDDHQGSLDDELIAHLREFVDRSPSDKLFVVLHCYGSHFNYRERYDDNSRKFLPDNASEASKQNRSELVNAYDNTVVFTDAMLDNLISYVDSLAIPAAVIYTSDHGEDIFDDARGRFLHASPTPTFTQLHVPFIIWTSGAYRNNFPDIDSLLAGHSSDNVSSSASVFPTTLSLAGIVSPKINSAIDLTSPYYSEPSRHYLNDYNEAVDLEKAGFRNFDFDKAKENNISTL
ncbi:MAG: lipid A phosphoethanolamine transferase [Muribaculaceae bacterium]|nr:lipid A phosphoethanolamine transferase [Muribaculaceae bacterium]